MVATSFIKRMHPMEFKEDAVKRANEKGANIPALAKELDINSTMLRRWMREKAEGHWDRDTYRRKPVPAVSNPPPTKNHSQPPKASGEVEELRKQLIKVTEERDLLKKTLSHYLKD